MNAATRPTLPGRKPPGERASYNDPPESKSSVVGTMDWLHTNNKPQPDRVYVDQRHSARKSGRINLKAVADVLSEHGLDPTVALVSIIRSGKLDVDVEARLLTTLLEYTQAKKKSVEITGAAGGPIQMENVSDALLWRIAQQALPEVEDVTDVEPKLELR